MGVATSMIATDRRLPPIVRSSSVVEGMGAGGVDKSSNGTPVRSNQNYHNNVCV